MNLIKYNKVYYTGTILSVCAVKIQNLEIVTTIYDECQLLLTIFDDVPDCKCILSLELSGERYNYNIIQNNGIEIAQLEDVLDEYIKQVQKVEW